MGHAASRGLVRRFTMHPYVVGVPEPTRPVSRVCTPNTIIPASGTRCASRVTSHFGPEISHFRTRHNIVPVQRICVTRSSLSKPNMVLYVINRTRGSISIHWTFARLGSMVIPADSAGSWWGPAAASDWHGHSIKSSLGACFGQEARY